ncbi:MAG: SDR family oxidoreductase [Actinobacteria bacterium]|nr:SDR family oxidoreductase [Actinomycetota bacterium]
MKLEGKVAVITGASRGIGEAIAKKFAMEGALLAIASRSKAIFKTAEGLRAPVLALQGDVSDPAFVERFFSETVDRYGGLDILINNAAVQGPIGPLAENDPGEWFKTIEINLFGAFLCCRAAIPLMSRQGGGKIVNFSGGGATSCRPYFSAYGASKTALVRMTETLAEEVRPLNIQVNAISPGAINTRMLEEVLEAGEKAGNSESKAARERIVAGGDPISKPVDLVLFLASNESVGLSGKLISAIWDDREEILRKASTLNGSDVYTLRRIC